MNEVFLKCLANRIKAEQMTIEQVPEVYRAEVQRLLETE
jgi:hypothetical protein